MNINSFKLLNIINNVFYFLFIFLPLEFKRFISKTEHELNRLMKLSEKTASINLTKSTDIKNIISKCIEVSKNIITYSSRTLLTDKNYPSNASSEERLIGRWRANFIRPSKTYVTQEMLDDEMGWEDDAWIFADKNQYINMGFWILVKNQEPMHEDANQNVLIDNWIRLINSESPISSCFYNYRKTQYLLVTYAPPSQSDEFTGTLFTKVTEEFKDICKIQLWINTKTFLISKGIIQVEGYVDNEYIFFKDSIAFGGYNEHVEINVPEEFQTME